jgi:hypothetical protein
VTGGRTGRSLPAAPTEARMAEAAGEAHREPAPAPAMLGRLLLGGASLTLLAVSLPVIIRGAPLADDFHNCLAPHDRGLLGFMSDSVERLGVIRPARFLEILLTTGVCQRLPFGIAIAVGLLLTFVVALLLRRLLTMLGSPAPWPEVAAAVWLLQPLGTEAALWPAALHVPLGLAAALGSLIAFRGGRLWLGALLGLAAMLSVEQTILALPLAAWLVSSPGRRRPVTITTTVLAATVVLAYLLLPGDDPRLSAGAAARVHGLFADAAFFARYPAVGFGAESIPLGVRWAGPVSAVVLVAGAVAGWQWMRRVRPAPPPVGSWNVRSLLAVAMLVVLVNAPVVLSQPRQGSPRVFTPTWLVLAAVAGLGLGWACRRHRMLLGAAAGLYLGGAVLSLALSAWVRVETATVVERVAHRLAAQTSDGDIVVLCEVPRAAVAPAPHGAFAVQDYLYEWSAADALRYYTGRRAVVRVFPAGSEAECRAGSATLVVPFDQVAEPDD